MEQARERLADAQKILGLVHPAVALNTAYYAMPSVARAASPSWSTSATAAPGTINASTEQLRRAVTSPETLKGRQGPSRRTLSAKRVRRDGPDGPHRSEGQPQPFLIVTSSIRTGIFGSSLFGPISSEMRLTTG